MPGDILIVDTVATNRIVLKVKLLAAQYRVRLCDSLTCARAEIAAKLPDLVLLDIAADTDRALALCEDLKSDIDTALMPVIATGGFLNPDDRVRALQVGADDVLTKPFNDQILQARIRSLLRARDASQELRLREDTRHALGFAEAPQGFQPPAEVILVSPSRKFAHAHQDTITALGNTRVREENSARTVAEIGEERSADLFVIDARQFAADENQLFRTLSELRSRTATRHASIMVVLPPQAHAAAAMALDLGANDIVSPDTSPTEIALRAKALIKAKQMSDLLRRTVRSGLEAAVTDPLTGLYNRRYALPHLSKLAERAEATGRRFAVMIMDLDHFKSINDRYGHAAGDEILVQVSERLRGNLRAVDLLARIGGEEFLVAVPDSDAIHARVAAERLCHLISGAPFFVGPNRQEVRVTMSIGVSLGGAGTDCALSAAPDELVHAADSALYQAKGAGRNTVSLTAA